MSAPPPPTGPSAGAPAAGPGAADGAAAGQGARADAGPDAAGLDATDPRTAAAAGSAAGRGAAPATGPGTGPPDGPDPAAISAAPPSEAPPLLRDPVSAGLPQSVLFCCDHNAVRSPMAEGLMKKLYGTSVYVQSAGVKSDLDVDGFAVAVCRELGIELARHRVRSFEQMRHLGDDLSAFDLIVALSPASLRQALDLTRLYHLRVEYWPVLDPTGLGETRDEKLSAYRQTRDQLHSRMLRRFGADPPATA